MLLAMLLMMGAAGADTYTLLTDDPWACTVNTFEAVRDAVSIFS